MAFPKKQKPAPEKAKTITVTVQFVMDEKTAKLFSQSSIERVINTSILLVDKVDVSEENVGVNLDDWKEWKPVVCGMWNAVRDAIFRVRAELSPAEPFTLRKGDL